MGFAAHELKNPLTSIKGYAATMLNESMFSAMNDDMKKNAIRIIQNNAERMQTIIGDLRDAAASEAGKLQMNLTPTSFRNVVVETLRPFQKQLEDKAQELVNTVPEDLPDVLGDPTRLIQVLTNLVSNAHKYSPPEASITIHAEVVPNVADLLEKHAAVRKDRTRRVGHYLYCTVSDTGIGMTPEDVAKLFREQYFRSDNPLAREQPGTGLGMMITWNIIQLHHGEIWVTSELNVGTMFHILLPLAPAPEKKPQAEPASD
jgi:signal transduction histidine kinase